MVGMLHSTNIITYTQQMLRNVTMENTNIHITSSNTQLRFLPRANKAYTVRVAELKLINQTQCPTT